MFFSILVNSKPKFNFLIWYFSPPFIIIIIEFVFQNLLDSRFPKSRCSKHGRKIRFQSTTICVFSRVKVNGRFKRKTCHGEIDCQDYGIAKSRKIFLEKEKVILIKMKNLAHIFHTIRQMRKVHGKGNKLF